MCDYMPFSMQEQRFQSSAGKALRKCRSVELRAGIFYPTCDCIKRNGLQHECRRTECQGKTCCMSKTGPTCNPANYAQRLANYSMGSSKRRGLIQEVKIKESPTPKVLDANEVPFTSGAEDFKDIDPNTLNQHIQSYPGVVSNGQYTTFNPAQMMSAPMQSFGSDPNAVPARQQFANVPAPMEPMPVIQNMPFASNGFNDAPAGISFNGPSVQCPTFNPYNPSMATYNPYSPNIPSYLPCGPGAQMQSGIPCGPC